MRTAFLLPLIALACTSAAPTNEPMDPAPTPTSPPVGDVSIHPIHHSALALEWNGHTVLVDPHAGAQLYAAYTAPELVLITDIHGDHMDPATLHELDLSKARIIAPKAVVDQLPAHLQALCNALANGESTELFGIGVEAIPMYNMPDPNDPRHPKGRGNGYVITFGTERIYISGDTEDVPEMRALQNIDVAFVCMNLPYTMTEQQAASGVLGFRPKVVYPYHYRGKDGFSDVALFERLVKEGDPTIEVRLVDWYAE